MIHSSQQDAPVVLVFPAGVSVSDSMIKSRVESHATPNALAQQKSFAGTDLAIGAQAALNDALR